MLKPTMFAQVLGLLPNTLCISDPEYNQPGKDRISAGYRLGQIAAALFVAVWIPIVSGATLAHAEPLKVELHRNQGGYQLFRDGQPYRILGAGGDASMKTLVACGGNSLRTWGVDELANVLDAAHQHNLTVAVGIWLGHVEQGFDYNNASQVAKQQEDALRVVHRFKDHPAVLLWGLGNEMEGFGDGDHPSVWKGINDLAVLVKRMDPNHPTMTVTAEIGGERIAYLNELCPDIDIHGINSYGGCSSLPQRYREAGGVKPYIVTEFGPAGPWEVAKTDWSAPLEPTSTEKAKMYREHYQDGIAAEFGGLCLGSYAFLWGNKTEGTATWFGMFLADGTRLPTVDAMQVLWTDKSSDSLCPRIQPLQVSGGTSVEPGTVLDVRLDVDDPKGDTLSATWALYPEDHPLQPPTAGGRGVVVFPDAIAQANVSGARVKMPDAGGRYRLYVYVRDQHGGGATANTPLLVVGPEVPFQMPVPTVQLPLQVVGDNADSPYQPTGWMGATDGIAMNPGCSEQPHSGNSCLEVRFTKPNAWGGVVWQDPPNDWGDQAGGLDLSGANQLTVWARGQAGGETVKVGFGVIGTDKPFRDSAGGSTELELTDAWQRFTIDVRGKDLNCIKTGFMWTVDRPCTFYLDDVRWE